MEVMEIINAGGLAGFAAIVFWRLTEIAKSVNAMSDSFIRMEERGYRLQRPTPPVDLAPRAITEDR